MSQKPYRVRNWSDYKKSLVKRGSITFWFSEEAIKNWHKVELTVKRSKPQQYSDIAIETLLLIKSVFKLDFRKLQGFAESLRELMSLEINIPSDPVAKSIVAELVSDAGFVPVDIGTLAESAVLDPGGVLFPHLFTPADMKLALKRR